MAGASQRHQLIVGIDRLTIGYTAALAVKAIYAVPRELADNAWRIRYDRHATLQEEASLDQRRADVLDTSTEHGISRTGIWKECPFAYVTGLTIGYGDLAPRQPLTQLLAIVIGFSGVLLTGLVAALAVKAFQADAARVVRQRLGAMRRSAVDRRPPGVYTLE